MQIFFKPVLEFKKNPHLKLSMPVSKLSMPVTTDYKKILQDTHQRPTKNYDFFRAFFFAPVF